MSIYVSCEDSTLVMILLFTVCLKIYFVASISVYLGLSLLVQFMWMVTWLVRRTYSNSNIHDILSLLFLRTTDPVINCHTHPKKNICHIHTLYSRSFTPQHLLPVSRVNFFFVLFPGIKNLDFFCKSKQLLSIQLHILCCSTVEQNFINISQGYMPQHCWLVFGVPNVSLLWNY